MLVIFLTDQTIISSCILQTQQTSCWLFLSSQISEEAYKEEGGGEGGEGGCVTKNTNLVTGIPAMSSLPVTPEFPHHLYSHDNSQARNGR